MAEPKILRVEAASLPFDLSFNLTPKPKLRIVNGKNNTRWLRAEGGEILALVRFCYSNKDRQPPLVVCCERGEGLGPINYECFRISGLTLSAQGADIRFYDPDVDGSSFSLRLAPRISADPSGKVITYVEAFPESFPMKEYREFRAGLLRRQMKMVRIEPKAG